MTLIAPFVIFMGMDRSNDSKTTLTRPYTGPIVLKILRVRYENKSVPTLSGLIPTVQRPSKTFNRLQFVTLRRAPTVI